MGILVQVRDVPEDVHRTLKARAALAGVSLTEYIRSVLNAAAARPSPDELAARIAARGAVKPTVSSQSLVRSLREHGE